MALEGNIDVFGAAEIVQLIAQQQKTGSLVLQKSGEQVEILFLNGEVAGAVPRPRTHGDPIGSMLVKAGIISDDVLANALQTQQKTFEFLGNILLDQGVVNARQIQRALYTQVYETFYSVLQWTEGRYVFQQKDVARAPLLPDLPPVESIMLDALRMIDEWQGIKSLFPAGNIVVEVTDVDGAQTLSDDELIIYSLVDGKRDIEEIADKSLLGMFTAYKMLSDMLNDGFIKAEGFTKKETEGDPSDKTAGGVFAPGALLRKNLNFVFSAALILFLALFLFVLPTGFPSNVFPFFNSENRGRTVLEQYFSFAEQSRAETKALINTLKHGSITRQ